MWWERLSYVAALIHESSVANVLVQKICSDIVSMQHFDKNIIFDDQ